MHRLKRRERSQYCMAELFLKYRDRDLASPPSAHDTLRTARPASLPAIIRSIYLSTSSMVPFVKMG